MSDRQNRTYVTLLEELTPDLERADAAETVKDLIEAIQDAQARLDRLVDNIMSFRRGSLAL